MHIMNCKTFEIIRNCKQKVKVSDAEELSASVGVLELWMYVHCTYIYIYVL
jgi:hypothetical protein